MKKILLLIFITTCALKSYAQYTVKGKVVSAHDGAAIAGATIQVKNNGTGVVTLPDGTFSLNTSLGRLTIMISAIGFEPKELALSAPYLQLLLVSLALDVTLLKDVVVSTGYQSLPKERATGSFVQIDNQLLNRSVGTNIIDRLQDIAPGLIFNRVDADNSLISIRGTSTINANAQPLIVVDNFPYEDDISTINPNDVESISILKDAAATSQWGARAGNGVVVITTKRGRYGQATRVSFNSNVTVGEKTDQYYVPKMSSSDYIEIEKRLFSEGVYAATEISTSRTPLTPIVELLIKKRDNPSLASEIDGQVEALKKYDVRNDYDKYYYRNPFNQQYALNISGGSTGQRYFIATGYDKNLDNLVGNDYGRITMNANNTYSFLKQKLEFTTGVYFVSANRAHNNPGTSTLGLGNAALYPYARLADDNGNPLNIARNYSNAFTTEAASAGLLDWTYRPLEEVAFADNVTKSANYRLNAGLKYKVFAGLNIDVLYQYSNANSNQRNYRSQAAYYTRNEINNLTVGNSDGSFTRPIPLGGIVDYTGVNLMSHNLRGQINYAKDWLGKHNLVVLAGAEIRDVNSLTNGYRWYGYDDEHSTSKAVDYVSTFTRYVNPLLTKVSIENADRQRDLTDRFISYYANGAYTYDKRYVVSGSARIDKSNLFGVNTNQKGVPLWSAGVAWNINKESFYRILWLSMLKVRATYGYSGNIDKSLSAYTTASYNSGNSTLTRLPFATVINPPNAELRWEKIRMANLGIDFGLKNSLLSGSIEFYDKRGKDLIGTTPFPPSTGIMAFTGNFADTEGKGIDVSLNSSNINKAIQWSSNFFFSYIADKVTTYKQATTLTAINYIESAGYSYLPLEGRPLYAIYSYRWGGLEPTTGNPQGYLNDELSTNYAAVRSGTTVDKMVYHGSARPTVFGAFRNNISYGNLSLSFNMSYRLGYYFRKASINYSTNYGLGGHGDYEQRWQGIGDELVTNVPSVPTTALRSNTARNLIYIYSDPLVDKADHIRLQDIRLDYRLEKKRLPLMPFQNLTLYAYMNNVAMLWTANRWSIDPDYQNGYQSSQPLRTIAFGLKADF